MQNSGHVESRLLPRRPFRGAGIAVGFSAAWPVNEDLAALTSGPAAHESINGIARECIRYRWK